MAAKKYGKKISMLEFRAWLQGVEDLQPADWVPNLEQWRMIRSKFDQIALPKEAAVVTSVDNTDRRYSQEHYSAPQHTAPPAMHFNGIPPAPLLDGGVPSNAIVTGGNAAGLLPVQRVNADGSIATALGGLGPDGTYRSAFT